MLELGERRRNTDRRWLLDCLALSVSEDPAKRYEALLELLGDTEDVAPGRRVDEMSDEGFRALGGLEKVVE